jgi:hypothetical protein
MPVREIWAVWCIHNHRQRLLEKKWPDRLNDSLIGGFQAFPRSPRQILRRPEEAAEQVQPGRQHCFLLLVQNNVLAMSFPEQINFSVQWKASSILNPSAEHMAAIAGSQLQP